MQPAKPDGASSPRIKSSYTQILTLLDSAFCDAGRGAEGTDGALPAVPRPGAGAPDCAFVRQAALLQLRGGLVRRRRRLRRRDRLTRPALHQPTLPLDGRVAARPATLAPARASVGRTG